jgi:hypothetical protein
MILIDEIKIEFKTIRFYDGIDFEMIHNHKGNDFLIFFIKSWKDEIKKWERDSKLNKLLYDKDYGDFDVHNMENNYVSIYQVGDNLPGVLEVVKKRLINKQDHTVFPWNIEGIV